MKRRRTPTILQLVGWRMTVTMEIESGNFRRIVGAYMATASFWTLVSTEPSPVVEMFVWFIVENCSATGCNRERFASNIACLSRKEIIIISHCEKKGSRSTQTKTKCSGCFSPYSSKSTLLPIDAAFGEG